MTNQNIPQDATQTPRPPVTLEVDACGLRCPMPLLKAKQALNALDAGQCVRVLATDKGSVRDFRTFARLSGHALLVFNDLGGRYEYILRKVN